MRLRRLFLEDLQPLAGLPFLIRAICRRRHRESGDSRRGLLLSGAGNRKPCAQRKRVDGVLRQVSGAHGERVQGDVGTAGAGGGKGQAAPAVAVGGVDLRGLVEDGEGLSRSWAWWTRFWPWATSRFGSSGDRGEQVEIELIGAGISRRRRQAPRPACA